MTLVEVVGGLGLLATLLVAILLARGRYMRQATMAQRRLQAIAAADALLTDWHQNPAALPRDGAGIVAGDRAMSWRTRLVANPQVNDLDAEVVRLEILDDRAQAPANPVLSSVEFVVERRSGNNADPKVNKGNLKQEGSRRRSR